MPADATSSKELKARRRWLMPKDSGQSDETNELEQFLYPMSHFYGEFTSDRLLLNANLQEFAQRVGYLVALETGGKLSTEDAYAEIRKLWKQLKRTKKQLEGPKEPPQQSQDNDRDS
jgi:hypothetical protein